MNAWIHNNVNKSICHFKSGKLYLCTLGRSCLLGGCGDGRFRDDLVRLDGTSTLSKSDAESSDENESRVLLVALRFLDGGGGGVAAGEDEVRAKLASDLRA